MALSSVPLFIEGGQARHQAQDLRRMLYLMLGGREGVAEPGDMAVLPRSTPGGGVRVLPGLAAMRARSAGAFREMYMGSVISQEDLAVTATTSSGPRSDMVIFRVENPYAPGEVWPVPANPVEGPYWKPRIIQGVPAGARTLLAAGRGNDTAIPLCRIDIPASTGTIDNSMIKDLRSIAGESDRNEDDVDNDITSSFWTEGRHVNGDGAGGVDYLNKIDVDWKNWPKQASWKVPVPKWASGMDLIATEVVAPLVEQANGIAGNSAHLYGQIRLLIDNGAAPMLPFELDQNGIHTTQSGGYRPGVLKMAGTVYLPASVRGRSVNMRFQARQYDSNLVTARVQATTGTYANLGVVFKRNPDFN